jgi:long-chain acyl-CoA synthetase
MGLHARDVILGAIPMSHSYGFSSVALPALVRGCAVAVPAEPGPLAPLESARAAGVTVMPTVPAYLQGLVALRRPEVWPRSVRLVVSAGARLTPATAAGFFDVFGQRVHCFYGASECGGITYDREGGAAERGTVGSPVDGVTIEIEGLKSGAEDGVVVVASDAVAEGYLNEPSPRLEGGRFRTSDRGSWTGGELRLGGRLDGIINVKGRKVDPGEVERVIAELDGVIDAIVLGVPGRHDGTEAVGAVVACRPGTLTAEDVVTFCRAHLAEHKVPRRVRLVDELPRTSRGKVDRGALLLGPERLGFST